MTDDAMARRALMARPFPSTRALPLLLAATLAVALVEAPVAAQRGNPELRQGGQSIDDMVAEFMRDNAISGMTLAIVQAPYVTRAAGYGVSDVATGRLASPNTLFRIDGLARAYTGVAVMQLVEAGRLALDEPVRARLADAPAGLSVAELLGRRPSPEDGLLLRRLVEQAAGESYEAFVRQHQIERLGLTRTVFASELAGLHQETIAAGGKHRRFLQDRGLVDPTETAVGSEGAPAAQAGTLYASAVDVSLWDIALAGELLIRDPALRKVLYSPPSGAEGRPAATSGAWDFPGHPGLMVVAGSGGGFSALLSRFTDPRELVCVTLLANRAGVDLSQLARRIAGAFDPRLGPPARAAAMRVQQSPYPVAETKRRLASTLGESSAQVEVWEEDGEVWAATADPVAAEGAVSADRAAQLQRRAAIDAALLLAVSP
jgi:D-alanyl-D-alanine carboxypeptidase